MKTEILIDADILLYKSTSASEEAVNWEEDLWTMHCDMARVKSYIVDYVEELREKINGDKIIMCLSHMNNFRKELNPLYKLNRKGTRKPMCFVPTKQYLIDSFNTVTKPWIEADDVMGVLASYKEEGVERVIVSEDKDLLTIPGLHWDAKMQVVFEQTQELADYQFFTQTLTGDSTDNYSGCKGVGPKKAERLLESVLEIGGNESQYWDTIVSAYHDAGQTTEDALMNARMARILRYGEYIQDQPLYWSPKNERG